MPCRVPITVLEFQNQNTAKDGWASKQKLPNMSRHMFLGSCTQSLQQVDLILGLHQLRLLPRWLISILRDGLPQI